MKQTNHLYITTIFSETSINDGVRTWHGIQFYRVARQCLWMRGCTQKTTSEIMIMYQRGNSSTYYATWIRKIAVSEYKSRFFVCLNNEKIRICNVLFINALSAFPFFAISYIRIRSNPVGNSIENNNQSQSKLENIF